MQRAAEKLVGVAFCSHSHGALLGVPELIADRTWGFRFAPSWVV